MPRLVAVAPQMRLVEDNTSNISLTDIFKQVWLPNSYVWWYVISIGLTGLLPNSYGGMVLDSRPHSGLLCIRYSIKSMYILLSDNRANIFPLC